MSEEEEEGIFIEDGKRREEFTVADANNDKLVQEKFQLDTQPANVFTLKGKLVLFGNLKDGKIYKLPKSQVLIPNQKIHTQNAAILSISVYQDHAIDILKQIDSPHTIKTICDETRYSKQKVMLAVGVVEGQNVLYVAYRGSKTRDDFMSDINIRQKEKEAQHEKCKLTGKFHAGFEERSDTVPIDYILECAEQEGCQTIVPCGHSLGGAVSSIVALGLMKDENVEQTEIQVFNITFGAPFFANNEVRKMCKEKEFEKNMVHYVDYMDIVPGLLSLEHTTCILRNHTIKLTDGVNQVLLENAMNYPKMAANVVKFIIENVSSGYTDEEVGILNNLCSNIMTGFEKTGLGKQYTDEMYVPIGNYILLENGAINVLDTESLTPQLRERILKDPISKVENVAEIMKGHSIDSYCQKLTPISLASKTQRRDITQKYFFVPRVEEKASIVWTNNGDGSWKCQLAARGRFLKSVQMNSCSFPQMPFKDTSVYINVPDGENEVILISEETNTKTETDPGQVVNLKLATPFGIAQLSVKEIRESNLNVDPKDISIQESVATILNKSVSRSLSIMNIKRGPNEPEDRLRTLIRQEVKGLDYQYRDKYKELLNCGDPLSRKDDISIVTTEMYKHMTHKITIHLKTSLEKYEKYQKEKEKARSGKNKKEGFWRNMGMFLSWVFGSSEEIEADYIKQLKAVLHEMTISGVLQEDDIKKDLQNEFLKDKNSPMAAYLLERLLMSYEEDREHLKKIETFCDAWFKELLDKLDGTHHSEMKACLKKEYCSANDFYKELKQIDPVREENRQWGEDGKDTNEVIEMMFENLSSFNDFALKDEVRNNGVWFNPSEKSESILAHLHEESKKMIENKLQTFTNVHAIRELYGNQCYIGFIGPQNSGKSTLINVLFGKRAETGMQSHTKEPTKYKIDDNVFAIDFPGSDSLEDQRCASLESSGHMNNFQVYVMQYNGSPNTQLIANVKLAYRLKKRSGKSAKTLFCMNKAAALQDDCDTFDGHYLQKFVQTIRKHIEDNPYDEKEEGLWKKLKEEAKREFRGDAYEKVASVNKKLKEYTLQEIKDDDFIFTDWKNPSPKKGIKGPEEVKKRIRDFLVDSNICTIEKSMDI